MDIQERVQIAILSKYYGALLTEKQQNILTMYVDNNLSLAEVSEELNISRQAVKDSVDKAIEILKDTENKLKFVARDDKLKQMIENKQLCQIDMMTKLELIRYLEE